MTTGPRALIHAMLLVALFMLSPTTLAQGEVNVYTSRHYDTDQELHALFTQKTGIKVNSIEGNADELLARLRSEGDLSPADVFVAVDAGRLQKAVDQGVFAPFESDVVTHNIPDFMRHDQGLYVGLSKRVRVIYLSDRVAPDLATTYADLADPKLRGKVLIRSSNNVYNQSMLAAFVAAYGPAETEAWAQGVVANMARTPQGGDTSQIRALAAGVGDVAVGNHYYFARMIELGDESDRQAAKTVRLVFPDQDGRGAHTNISGVGLIKSAPNRENAIRYIEFLTTPEAQEIYALKNFEYPAVSGLELPEVLGNLGARGPVKRALRGIEAWLHDPGTRLHIVTLPGALPVQET
ncbi:MAG: extracellular solute-binding protein, partial [Planctomycetota bacterium]